MLPDYEIALGRGIGNILFGMPKKDLTEIFGPPDDIEHPEEPEKDDWVTFVYNAINCSFSFDPGQEDRLVEISIENGYFHFHKKIRTGIAKEELLRFGSEFNFGKSGIEDIRDEEFPDRELISFDAVGMKLFLDEGKVSVIRISPLRDDTGSVIWPVMDENNEPS
jgi:hypothetical protein